MTRLPLIGFILILLGFTGLLLTGAVDWARVEIDPQTTWGFITVGLMGVGFLILFWRKR